ncbi:penicillin acylase family protein [Halobacillus campisalis]|uniref:Penicillin acylase family protein n=1 Tax=Halobacillus campisalis TaxID=435909 RepID=A0ABW2K5I7_9BACI|nr:penicillin acylase family protein [Halobacillus campisalis]
MEPLKEIEHEKRKIKRWKKVTLVITGVIMLLMAAALIFVNAYINRSLPETVGQIKLEGLSEEVSIIRDEQGVPNIKAKSDEDLFRAQGYVQAQDRMFQMELARRQASGTLSEVVGSTAIDQDKYFRTLGLRRAAEKSIQEYSEEALKSLEAFAEGVNEYIAQAVDQNKLPAEFILMGIEPEPWEPVDSLTIGKYMAFDLGGHWERQAFNYYAMQEFSPEEAEELMPAYPENAPTILDEETIDIASSFKGAVLPQEFNGSNNWVIDGSLTSSGSPLLADDPHLGLATPSIWYQMTLNSPDYNVSGVIFAGVPGIILGHNEDVAWGVTNVGPDVQQLYMEKRNPENENEFLFEEKWEEAEVINEPIRVKGEDTIDYSVTETRHGPVISEFAENTGESSVLSLRWTALDPTTELEAILEINKARNWEEFENGLEKFLAPAQNFVYADKEGNIAYKANGRIPIYENPDDALLPLRGWTSEDEWNGFIPFDELPGAVNPEEGFIATANNKITTVEYPYHISHNWAQPYRYQRIIDMINGKDNHTSKDMKDMQLDVLNLQAEEFLIYLLDQLEGSNEETIQLMNDWNYKDEENLPQPLIFHRWMLAIQDQIFSKKIPKDMLEFFKGAGQTTDEILRTSMKGEESIWLEEAGGIENVVQLAFDETLIELKEEQVQEPADWEWGKWHAVEFTHPLSSIGFLERFYNPGAPVPVSGSRITVRAAGFNNSGIVDHGASWRFVMDLADPSKAEHVVGPGQAGHFRSEWYHNQLGDWVSGKYHTTLLNESDGSELTLHP